MTVEEQQVSATRRQRLNRVSSKWRHHEVTCQEIWSRVNRLHEQINIDILTDFFSFQCFNSCIFLHKENNTQRPENYVTLRFYGSIAGHEAAWYKPILNQSSL